MKAVQIGDASTLQIIDIERPRPEGGEVLLDVKYCGICGSDLRALKSGRRRGQVMGHEFTGVIADIGPDVRDWHVGDRVTVIPLVACGECVGCVAGHPNMCETGLWRGPGIGRQGAYAEALTVPIGMLHRLPEEVTDRDGALTEPLAVALHAINLSGVSRQDRICVLGGGPIGVMTVVGLRARGHERLILVEPVNVRRAAVAALGVPAVGLEDTATAVSDTLGAPPTVVIDCTGHPSGLSLGVDLLEVAGRLTMVGVVDKPAPLDIVKLESKELVIRGSLAYSPDEFAAALVHIAAGHVPADHIITQVADLGEAAACFDDLTSGATRQLKVLLRP